jgi:Rrf2 family protein
MDTRFALAVHMLVYLNTPAGRGQRAELIARSVGTHPVRVRQILGQLASAGLISTLRGRLGGSTLGKRAEAITLADVFVAIYDAPELLPLHPDPSPHCLVGRSIHLALMAPLTMAEAYLRESLRETTVAELTTAVVEAARRRQARAVT